MAPPARERELPSTRAPVAEYFEDLEVTNISPGSHTATLLADPESLITEFEEGDNSWDYLGDWSNKASVSTTPGTAPEARIHVAPIPGCRRPSRISCSTSGLT